MSHPIRKAAQVKLGKSLTALPPASPDAINPYTSRPELPEPSGQGLSQTPIQAQPERSGEK